MSAVKSMLAVISNPVSGRECLHTAIRLGRQLDCQVDALHVLADPTAALPLVGEAMSGAMVDEMMGVAEREAGQRANLTKSMYDDVVSGLGDIDPKPSGAGFRLRWMEESGVEEQIVALHISYIDRRINTIENGLKGTLAYGF